MKWSKRLFYGEKASKKKFKLIKSVNKRSVTPFLYIIALIDGELCIISQVIFNAIYYKKRNLFKNFFKREQYNILILGLAISRYEANELIRDMVDEVYKNTSSFDYQKYFERE